MGPRQCLNKAQTNDSKGLIPVADYACHVPYLYTRSWPYHMPRRCAIIMVATTNKSTPNMRLRVAARTRELSAEPVHTPRNMHPKNINTKEVMDSEPTFRELMAAARSGCEKYPMDPNNEFTAITNKLVPTLLAISMPCAVA